MRCRLNEAAVVFFGNIPYGDVFGKRHVVAQVILKDDSGLHP